jgi:hypothetical protein
MRVVRHLAINCDYCAYSCFAGWRVPGGRVDSFVSISLDGSDGRFDLDLGSCSACVLMGRHAARAVHREFV